MRDPNGMLLELTSDAANVLERKEAAAASAHEVLAEWSSGDYAGDGAEEVPMAFPLSTSPAEDIVTVIRGAGPGERPRQP